MNNQPRGELVPGGLAMVSGCREDPIHVGKIVTTERTAVCGERTPSGNTFWNRDGVEVWLCSGDSLVSTKREGGRIGSGYAYIEAKFLLPINPSADPLEITQQQEEKV